MIPSTESLTTADVPFGEIAAPSAGGRSCPAIACPVCGCELRGEIQACRDCHTPLHADCASFMGRCATFGCGGTEFVVADGDPSTAEAPAFEIVDRRPEGGGPVLVGKATEPTFRRGVAGRTWAGSGILAARPGVTIPLVTLLILSNSFAFIPFLTQFIGLLGQGLLVILLTAQARGKDSSVREALTLLNQRGLRVLSSGIAYSIFWSVPAILGAGLMVTGAAASSWIMGLTGLALAALSLRNAVSYSLVTVIAAMGTDEEPGNVFRRSAELVAPGRLQALAGVSCFALATEGFAWLVLMMLFWIGSPTGVWAAILTVMVTKPILMLLSTAYWLLYYLEARRIRQTDYLPFAPHGYLPRRGAIEEEIG